MNKRTHLSDGRKGRPASYRRKDAPNTHSDVQIPVEALIMKIHSIYSKATPAVESAIQLHSFGITDEYFRVHFSDQLDRDLGVVVRTDIENALRDLWRKK